MTNGVPYEILDGAIIDFITAYTTQCKQGKRFEMKFLKKKDNHSLSIRARDIKRKGKIVMFNGNKGSKNLKNIKRRWSLYCYPKIFGSKTNLACKKKIPIINHSCRLVWCKDRFELHVPVDIEIPPSKSTGVICALDPGVRTFQTIYGTDGVAYSVGNETLDDQVKLAQKLRNGINRDGIKVKNRKARRNLLKKASKIEQKIKDKNSDIHHKLCKFLTKRYDAIVIPRFSTKQMTMKHQLSKTTNRQMYRWGHYRFRTLLIAKGVKYGCKVMVGTEQYTSVTCGRCFNVKRDLGGNKVYCCNKCNAIFDRDLNAARNILMLNWNRFQFQTGLPSYP